MLTSPHTGEPMTLAEVILDNNVMATIDEKGRPLNKVMDYERLVWAMVKMEKKYTDEIKALKDQVEKLKTKT